MSIVQRWPGPQHDELCCRIIGFQKCREKFFGDNPESCPLVSFDISSLDPKFIQILFDKTELEKLIQVNCLGIKCISGGSLSLFATLIIVLSSIIFFAICSFLVMNKFKK